MFKFSEIINPLFLTLIIVFYFNIFSAQQLCGVFTQITDSPFLAGSAPYSVAFSPLVGTNLYAGVANEASSNVSVYSVDNLTGVFTQIADSPFAAGSGPYSISFSPLIGTNIIYAAVANEGGANVSVYSVDSLTGIFTQVADSPFATGLGPVSVAFSPLIGTNLYAAVSNFYDNTVSVYSVDSLTGVFTQVGSPFATGSEPLSVAFSPLIGTNTVYAVVANSNDDTVSVYSVDSLTGVFTQIADSPFAAGSRPVSVAFSPLIGTNIIYAAVANEGGANVSVFSVDSLTGIFTQVADSPFAAGSNPVSVAFSPLIGTNLYAAVANEGSANVSVFSVDSLTGIFTQVADSPFAAGSEPSSVVFSPVIGTNTVYAAVNNVADADVSVYNVDSSPTVSISPKSQSVCAGGAITLIANTTGGSGTYSQYIWTTPGRGFQITSGNMLTLLDATSADVGNYTVIVTDNTGCSSSSSSSATVIVSIPVVTVTASSTFILLGESVIFTATPSGGKTPYELVWSDGFIQSNVTSRATRTVMPSATTTYNVTIIDANSCRSDPSNIVSVVVSNQQSTLAHAIFEKYCLI